MKPFPVTYLGILFLSCILSVVAQLTVSCGELSNYELEGTNANELCMSRPEQTGQLMLTSGGCLSYQIVGFHGSSWHGCLPKWGAVCAVGGCLSIQVLWLRDRGFSLQNSMSWMFITSAGLSKLLFRGMSALCNRITENTTSICDRSLQKPKIN